MARTVAKVEQALAVVMDIRWTTKDSIVKKLADGRVKELRQELKAAKAGQKAS